MRDDVKGFSLIELVMVIVIVSILLLVLVKWPTTDANIYGEARKIASDLRYIQHLSQTKQQRYRINFTANNYTLTNLDNTLFVVQVANNQSTQTLPAGMSLTTNLPNGYLVFSEQGVPYVDNQTPGTVLSSTATITLTVAGKIEVISVYPTTGAVIVNP